MCRWCYSYQWGKWNWWSEFKYRLKLVCSLYTNTFEEKNITQSIFYLSYKQNSRRNCFFSFGKTSGLRKQQLWGRQKGIISISFSRTIMAMLSFHKVNQIIWIKTGFMQIHVQYFYEIKYWTAAFFLLPYFIFVIAIFSSLKKILIKNTLYETITLHYSGYHLTWCSVFSHSLVLKPGSW